MDKEQIRDVRKTKNRSRKVLILLLGFILGGFAAIIAYVIRNPGIKGHPMSIAEVGSEKIYFDADPEMAQLGHENFMLYVPTAYVVIGEYPTWELFKISANVPKNNYNWETDFTVPAGGLYYNYFENGEGEAKGRVAIDVSEFQKSIDWAKVKGAGIDVAIVRVGYRGYGQGKIVDDALYQQNLQGAQDNGIATGVYFFSQAINADEGVEEANYVLEKIKGYNVTEPIIIDTEEVEDPEGRGNKSTVEARTDGIVAFCETIEAAGYTPMIYASRNWFVKDLDIDRIGKYEFWLACYDTPVFPYHAEGYQYTPSGYVDGIPTQVDLDVWMR